MVIINNVSNTQIAQVNQLHQKTQENPLPAWQQKLHELIQDYIERTPAKIVSRQLRNYFLLEVASLETISAEWEDKVLHFLAMLELLDAAEDISGGGF